MSIGFIKRLNQIPRPAREAFLDIIAAVASAAFFFYDTFIFTKGKTPRMTALFGDAALIPKGLPRYEFNAFF